MRGVRDINARRVQGVGLLRAPLVPDRHGRRAAPRMTDRCGCRQMGAVRDQRRGDVHGYPKPIESICGTGSSDLQDCPPSTTSSGTGDERRRIGHQEGDCVRDLHRRCPTGPWSLPRSAGPASARRASSRHRARQHGVDADPRRCASSAAATCVSPRSPPLRRAVGGVVGKGSQRAGAAGVDDRRAVGDTVREDMPGYPGTDPMCLPAGSLSKPAAVSSASAARCSTPALLTSVLSEPNASRTVVTAAAHCCSEVTSSGTAITPSSASRSTPAVSSSPARSAAATLMPSARNRCTMAAPCPGRLRSPERRDRSAAAPVARRIGLRW